MAALGTDGGNTRWRLFRGRCSWKKAKDYSASDIFAVCPLLLLLQSCGYVGPVVPPSPDIPSTVTDLTAIERGDQIVIHFSTPARTTDNLTIKRFSTLDLRVGPPPSPFDFEKWSSSAKSYEIEPPEVRDPGDPRAIPVDKQIPASDWIGKHVAIAVRTGEKRKGHLSAWSNRGVLDVVEPLQPPKVEAAASPEGYTLKWPPQRDGLHYEVLRKGPGEPSPVSIGTAEKPAYLDTTSQWDTPYEYFVIARQGGAESFPSEAVGVNHPNTFPPSVPGSVAALATPTAVEVSWQRSPEASLKGYTVYRSDGGGTFEKQGDLVVLPAYTDRNVQHGHNYRYQITSVSQAGFESAKSPATDPVTFR